MIKCQGRKCFILVQLDIGLSSNVKVNIIKDYKVAEKKVVELPDKIEGIVKCVNPMCITNQEVVRTKFDLVTRQPVSIKCHYCEKITDAKISSLTLMKTCSNTIPTGFPFKEPSNGTGLTLSQTNPTAIASNATAIVKRTI